MRVAVDEHAVRRVMRDDGRIRKKINAARKAIEQGTCKALVETAKKWDLEEDRSPFVSALEFFVKVLLGYKDIRDRNIVSASKDIAHACTIFASNAYDGDGLRERGLALLERLIKGCHYRASGEGICNGFLDDGTEDGLEVIEWALAKAELETFHIYIAFDAAAIDYIFLMAWEGSVPAIGMVITVDGDIRRTNAAVSNHLLADRVNSLALFSLRVMFSKIIFAREEDCDFAMERISAHELKTVAKTHSHFGYTLSLALSSLILAKETPPACLDAIPMIASAMAITPDAGHISQVFSSKTFYQRHSRFVNEILGYRQGLAFFRSLMIGKCTDALCTFVLRVASWKDVPRADRKATRDAVVALRLRTKKYFTSPLDDAVEQLVAAL
ncbi:Hypothetical Protein FCC1311_106212 [Hondaea fermentalgiana]|uniref:Uncharacterized protein n=1 Tax=Hondaea fermentalgiana TaxID=2315210 RepID=A0A2R5GU48_9STRA|nr:Hypothetical Protein FCC1311_106212 [Hondaea fermentalgiana]|eukprot:GBG34397.1 Hypothetical Protein FCC1311_106212 [Hondaea fermentalgiana]